MSQSITRRAFAGTAMLFTPALALSACGGDDQGGGGGGAPAEPVDATALLEEGGELTVWAWTQSFHDALDATAEAFPNLTIDIVNVGTGEEHYTALQNAISAGSGGPDIAQVELSTVPQFMLADALVDLSPFGAGELEGTFTPGPWSSVTDEDGGVYALPTDSGPMALFYNASVFEEHGIEVPATWEDFREAGRALQEADPDVFITNDTGDAGLMTSLIWQAGGRPFQVDGTELSIDLDDAGSQTAGEFWNTMVDEGLLAPITGWSDEWYQGLGDGTIASLVLGGWMRGNLESGVEAGAGDWRVAPIPQWEEGESVSAENGGSSLAAMSASSNHELAYALLHYLTVGEGVNTIVESGAFPANVEQLQSDEFTNAEFDYFGGQKVNEVLAESAENVADGWQYPPFYVYANSVFNDTVGQAFVSDITITEGLADWEETLVTYAEDQGFTVTSP